MRVTRVEPIPMIDLSKTLQNVKLRGHGEARVYGDALIQLQRNVSPHTLAPTQRYVLMPIIHRTHVLRQELLSYDVDMFNLNGGLWIWTEETGDEPIPLTPPIIEQDSYPNGRSCQIIADGMHRVYAAMMMSTRITCLFVYGASHPYYAHPLSRGWDEVIAFGELPDGFEKKSYREPNDYKALFRQFNDLYPGLQADRKQTNPKYLKKGT